MEKRLNKLLHNIKPKQYPILAFITSVVLVTMVFSFLSVAPGGFRMLYINDFYGEYLNFLTNLKHIFQGKESAIYSWNIDLGMGIMGLNAYYMASPLNIMIVWLDEYYLINGAVCLVILRVGLAATTAYICLRHIYLKKHPEYLEDKYRLFSILFIAVCYSMCGWIMNNFFNVLWQDAIFILPLVMYFIIKLIETGKMKGLIISFTYIFISNYYMGYMIGIFSTIVFISLIIYVKKIEESTECRADNITKEAKIEYKKYMSKRYIINIIIKYFLCVINAAMIASALLLPSFLQIREKISENNSSINVSGINFGILSFINGLFVGSYTSLESGNPSIYCGISVLFLAILFFLGKKAKKQDKIYAVIMLGIMFLLMCIQLFNICMHAFDMPDWFRFRYSYCFSFIIAIIACFGIDEIKKLDRKKLIKIYTAILGWLLVYFILTNVLYRFLNKEKLVNYGIFRCNISEFIANAVIMALIGILIAACNEGIIIKRDACLIAIILLLIEETVNFAIIIDGVSTESGFFKYDYVQEEVDFLENQVDVINYKDEGVYRIESNHIVSYNDSLAIGYRGVTNYTSICNYNLNKALYKFGLKVNDWKLEYEGQTTPVESLLNIKYMLHFEPRSWLDETEVGENFYVRENEYYLPIGFMVSEKIMNFTMENQAEGNDNLQKKDTNHNNSTAIENQNKLFSTMTNIESECFKRVDNTVYVEKLDNLKREYLDNGSIRYTKVSKEKNASISYIIPYDSSYRYYYSYDYDYSRGYYEGVITTSSNIGVDSSSTEKKELKVPRNICINDNLEDEPDNISITLQIEDNEITFLSEGLYIYCQDEYSNIYNKLSENTLEVTNFTDTSLSGKVTAKKNQILYTSIPYDKGWKLKVDGKESKTISLIDGAFLGVELDEGEHTIELNYTPEGLKAGIWLSVIGILILAGIIIYEQKLKSRAKKM